MSKIEIIDGSNSKEIISLNGYKIKERIGVGSYGRVYKVFKNKVYYVLKEIPLNLSNAVEKINSVQNEAEILSSLNNKYVVKFYESFKINQNIYILMEYCDNGDLCTFLNKVKKQRKNENYFLDEDFVWKLFIQMSIGLYYIHSKKIIHRDIKTLNIFLTKDLDAKIGDLGVAKILEDTNHANTFIGTPYYVSPEMCRNRPYNEKSDIWALGCILYELLTFNHPFTANTQPALFIKILNSKFNPFPPGVPEDLRNMVEFILQKNDKERPSMKDIITSNSFQYNALRIGLENDLKEVLKVDVLPILKMNKHIKNIENNINNCKTYIRQKCDNKKYNTNNIKRQKNSLITSKSLNPLSANKKSFVKIYSNNNIFKSRYDLINKSLNKKSNNNNDSNSNSHIRLIKNNGFQEEEKSINKRTRSDFNYYIETNNNNYDKDKTDKYKIFKTSQNKDSKNNQKKYSILNSILINPNKNNVCPRKTRYLIKSRKKINDFSDKNIKNIKDNKKNNNSNSIRFYTGSKLNEKINNNLNNYESSKDRIIKDMKRKTNIDIKNERILNNSNKKEKSNMEHSDIISVSDFMKELNSVIKSTPKIVTLKDLLNHNFNSDDSKNLNTTSATTLLGKLENPSLNIEQKNELNKCELKNKEKIESLNNNEDDDDFFSASCDEFTSNEIIQRTEPYLINPIPLSNYQIKINENKKEINNIKKLSKDELMSTKLFYKNKYEKYLEDIKKYSNIIDINYIKKMYSNINYLNNKNIKKIFDSITHYAKNKAPKEKVDEIIDILYNLVSFEIKYKMAENAIKY